MMILSLHKPTQTTEYLRPIFGFLHSLMTLCGISGGTLPLGIREQGRKPSGIIWADSLFGTNYGSDTPANNNEQPAVDDDARRRCRSHSERFHT
jgi:hypothetical protein